MIWFLLFYRGFSRFMQQLSFWLLLIFIQRLFCRSELKMNLNFLLTWKGQRQFRNASDWKDCRMIFIRISPYFTADVYLFGTGGTVAENWLQVSPPGSIVTSFTHLYLEESVNRGLNRLACRHCLMYLWSFATSHFWHVILVWGRVDGSSVIRFLIKRTSRFNYEPNYFLT